MTKPINSKPVSEIFETEEYEVFSFISTQRDLVPSNIDRITASMKKYGFVKELPIIVNENFEIMDGQHRFDVARRMCLPIYYAFSKDMDVEKVRVLANAQKKWSLEDYLSSQARQGNMGARKLIVYKMKSRLTWDPFLGLVYGRGNKAVKDDIKAGRFVLTETKQGEIEKLMEQFKIFENTFRSWDTMHFTAACSAMFGMPGYDNKVMEKKLEYLSRTLVPCVRSADYLLLLEEIYNYKTHAENRVDWSRAIKTRLGGR